MSSLPPVICRTPHSVGKVETLNGVSVEYRVEHVWRTPGDGERSQETLFRVAGNVTRRGETYAVEMTIPWPCDARAAVENFRKSMRLRQHDRFCPECELSCAVTGEITLIWRTDADRKQATSAVFAKDGERILAEFSKDEFERLSYAMLGHI